MHDPYTPPQAPVGMASERAKKSGVLFWFVALGATMVSLRLGWFASFALPAFEKVYLSFGPNLPAPTTLLLQGRYALWLPLALAIGLWLYRARVRHHPRSRLRVLQCFLALGLISVALLLASVWAAYLPVRMPGAFS